MSAIPVLQFARKIQGLSDIVGRRQGKSGCAAKQNVGLVLFTEDFNYPPFRALDLFPDNDAIYQDRIFWEPVGGNRVQKLVVVVRSHFNK